MKTMGISEFKAHALKILDSIAKSHESLTLPNVADHWCRSTRVCPRKRVRCPGDSRIR